MIIFLGMAAIAAVLLPIYAMSHATAIIVGLVILAVIIADARACARRARRRS